MAVGDEVDVRSPWTAGRARSTCPLPRGGAAQDETAPGRFDGCPTRFERNGRWIEEAKKAETRATRLTKTVESLREGKRTR